MSLSFSKTTHCIVHFICLIGFAFIFTLQSLKSQASADGYASAKIVAPIEITKDVDLNFGIIAVSASSPGTVILAPNGVRTKTGGVTLPQIDGNPTAASFTVTGEDKYTYFLLIPKTDHIIKHASSKSEMIVNAFTSSPEDKDLKLDKGKQTIYIGATLNVKSGQEPGIYTSVSPFSVTVNYN